MTLLAADDFLNLLRGFAAGRKRVAAVDYRRIFAEMFPALAAPDARAKLAGWLAILAESGDIAIPKNSRSYDRSDSGDLPVWVELTDTDPCQKPLPVDPEAFPWAPELRFAHRLRDPRQLEVLLCVQHFLASGGRERPLVPVKERSVEVFGKEKRLELLRNTTLFAPGRLSLELLRCFIVPPPLVWNAPSPAGASGPVLILENHNTYHSFVLWNRGAMCYAAVVFGNGDAFKAGAAGLVEVVRSLSWDGRLLYFGDVDPEGLAIPLAASATLSTVDMPPIQAHSGCYRRLISRAAAVELPTVSKLALSLDAATWLGEELARDVEPWFEKGVRLPQELVGWEQLTLDGAKFAAG